jgi:ABC-type uncharacterized transport system substrate-binding protein
MNRRELLGVMAGAGAVGPFTARAQQKQPLPVIGYLSLGSPATRAQFLADFYSGLRENGYVEGRNVAVEYRWAGADPERFPALAAELVAQRVDVIVTVGGSAAAFAAKRATAAIPIVFSAVGDPVGEGLVASLARPGGNITGLSFFQPDLIGKRLELLRETVPEAALIAVLLKPDAMAETVKAARLQQAEASAQRLGVGLQVFEARIPEDLDRAFREISTARASALTVFATPLFILERSRIADLALKNRLPALSEFREFPQAGGFMSYGPNIPDLYRRAAGYVAKILRGTKPEDLPVEQPTKLELVVNLKTAKALGITVPQSLLARADEVIE